LLACLMTFFQMAGRDARGHEAFLLQYTDSMSSSTWIIGLLWAAVVGAGVFSAEIDFHIGEFWRTWPVPFWRLFAIKFLVGLLAVLAVLDGSTIAASWNSPHWGTYDCMNWSYIVCIIPLHATLFAFAVAWACVLRRPVLGGMAAYGSFMMVEIGFDRWQATCQFDPIQVYNDLARKSELTHGAIDFTANSYPIVAIAMGVVFIASIAIAAFALHRYAPRRQAA
jgi:hypothetical protein